MAPQKLLEGKVALVTGSGSGYGEGIAKLFTEEGAKILIGDINEKGGKRMMDEINAQNQSAAFIRMDVTSRKDWDQALQFATTTFGGLDILVNNAGWTYRRKDTLTVTDHEYDKVFDINVKSMFHATNAVIPHFLAKGSGSIINITSCITVKATTGLTWYGASKGAVDMITRHLAAEYSTQGIRVNCVSPSVGNTALFSDFIANDNPNAQTIADLHTSVGRLCTPLDIAKGALYFASNYFNYFQTLVHENPSDIAVDRSVRVLFSVLMAVTMYDPAALMFARS